MSLRPYMETTLDQLDVVITDSELPEDTQKRVEELGVELRLADLR